MANGTANSERSASRAFLTYNLLRAALFGACFGLGWIAGLRSILLIVVALLVSGILSWFALGRQRVALGQALERQVERSRVRMAERASAEDDLVDAMTTEATPPNDHPTA